MGTVYIPLLAEGTVKAVYVFQLATGTAKSPADGWSDSRNITSSTRATESTFTGGITGIAHVLWLKKVHFSNS